LFANAFELQLEDDPMPIHQYTPLKRGVFYVWRRGTLQLDRPKLLCQGREREREKPKYVLTNTITATHCGLIKNSCGWQQTRNAQRKQQRQLATLLIFALFIQKSHAAVEKCRLISENGVCLG